MNITNKHITKQSLNSKLKEKYYINEETHLAPEKKIVLSHSLKINKQGGPNKLRGLQKIEKLISVMIKISTLEDRIEKMKTCLLVSSAEKESQTTQMHP